jgi:Na+-driven multidrug efflux pump
MKLFHSAGRQKKTGTDMTQGSPFRLIMAFALPLFIGNIFQQFYNVVDSVVVGRFVGSQALAAVGCSGTPFGFFMTLIQGFTAAASVLISQA